MAEPLTWYYDFLSPFAYLQLECLRRDHPTLPLRPVGVVLGAILGEVGQLGPAEIPGKRAFTYRYVAWRAAELGLPLRFPPAHPFNSLAALRLAAVVGQDVARVQRLFRWIWAEGQPADSAAALAPLAQEWGIEDVEARISDPAIKQCLIASTQAAIAAGVWGVPTLAVHGELFWGQDATAMALAAWAQPAMLQAPDWQALGTVPVGVVRRK